MKWYVFRCCSVAYSRRYQKVTRLLRKLAMRINVLKSPPLHAGSGVATMVFIFQLLVWTSTLTHQRGKFIQLRSLRHHRNKFSEHGITIPFPKRPSPGKSGFQEERKTMILPTYQAFCHLSSGYFYYSSEGAISSRPMKYG